jgi:hypothetical protein
MKQFLVTIFFLTTTIIAFGQSEYYEVVYLKTGSVIRGVIVEQIPNKQIKIETADGNIFVIQIDEIERITKEPVNNRNSRAKSTTQGGGGFIGLSLCASLPVGDFADVAETGVQLNLVNFGYLFSDNIGVSATWFGAANSLSDKRIDPWSYGGLMVGPMLSFPISQEVDWVLRPMIGLSVATLPNVLIWDETGSAIGSGPDNAFSFAFIVGTVFKVNVSRNVSILLSADYFSVNPEFMEANIERQISTVSLGCGIAYRLK